MANSYSKAGHSNRVVTYEHSCVPLWEWCNATTYIQVHSYDSWCFSGNLYCKCDVSEESPCTSNKYLGGVPRFRTPYHWVAGAYTCRLHDQGTDEICTIWPRHFNVGGHTNIAASRSGRNYGRYLRLTSPPTSGPSDSNVPTASLGARLGSSAPPSGRCPPGPGSARR